MCPLGKWALVPSETEIERKRVDEKAIGNETGTKTENDNEIRNKN